MAILIIRGAHFDGIDRRVRQPAIVLIGGGSKPAATIRSAMSRSVPSATMSASQFHLGERALRLAGLGKLSIIFQLFRRSFWRLKLTIARLISTFKA